MKENVTYSFVIPHHNTPDLLKRLIDSIPHREDIEIIVVDDNSDADKKADITRSNVKVIYIDKEQSRGAGKARNLGMAAATGKWLLFADADDIYKPNFIKVLDEYKDDDIEILFFNVDSVDSDTLEYGHDRTKLEQRIVEGYDGSSQKADELLFLRWGPWRKMLKTDFVRYYGFFYEEIPNGNDVLFSLMTSYFTTKWKVDKRILYSLSYRVGSITYSKLNKRKYSTTINNLVRRREFFNFIGHPEWMSVLNRGTEIPSLFQYILRKLKYRPLKGLEILYYYLTHWKSIHNGAGYYVDVVKVIELSTKYANRK